MYTARRVGVSWSRSSGWTNWISGIRHPHGFDVCLKLSIVQVAIPLSDSSFPRALLVFVSTFLIGAVYFCTAIMQMPQTFNWLQYVPPGPSSVDIKIEPSFQDSEFSLLSPSPPSVTRSEPSLSSFTISSPLRKRSNTTLASPKRVRPYPSSSPHEHRFRREGSGRMAHQSFGPWSTSGRAGNNRPLNSGERRSSDDDQLSSYTLSNVYDPVSFPPPLFL